MDRHDIGTLQRSHARRLVGREHELGELRAGVAAAVAGSGQLLLLTGEAGIGKTSLIEAIAAQAGSEGLRVAFGRCWESQGSPVLWPWIEVVRDLLEEIALDQIETELGPAAAHITRLLPSDRDLSPQPGPAPVGEWDGARVALFDAVVTLVGWQSDRAPLLVVLEDLHAADEPTLELLVFATQRLTRRRVIFVGSYRPQEARASPRTAELLTELAKGATRIWLTGLGPTDASTLVERTARRPVAVEVRQAVHRATGGNPFFIGEIVRLLATSGALDRTERLPVPDEVRAVIRGRLALLPEQTRAVLAAAAVHGREFTIHVLRAVTGASAGDLLAMLDSALEGGVVVRAGHGDQRYAFAHDLMRETIYVDLPAPRRIELHAQVGTALERAPLFDADVFEMAHHFLEAAAAGHAEKALEYAVRAGRASQARFAWEQAAQFYERALDLADASRQLDPAARCELLLDLGDCQWKGRDIAQARETCLLAAELARSCGRGDLLARAALGFAGQHESGPLEDPGIELLEEGLAAVTDRATALRARLLSRLASAHFWASRPERAHPLSRESVSLMRRIRDPSTRIFVLRGRQYALAEPQNAPERLQAATELIDSAADAADLDGEALARGWRICTLFMLAAVDSLEADLSEFARVAERVGRPLHDYTFKAWKASLAILRGRFRAGERLAAEALEIGMMGLDLEQAIHTAQIFSVRRDQGRLAELRDAMDELVERRSESPWSAMQGVLEMELGNRYQAQRTLDVYLDAGLDSIPRDLFWTFTMTHLADLAASLENTTAATELYAALAPFADRYSTDDSAFGCAGLVATKLGLLAAAQSLWSDARRHFESAMATARRIGALPDLARAQLAYAKTLVREGTADGLVAARSLAQECYAIAAEVGMKHVRRDASSLLEMIGARAPAPPERDWGTLTETEQRVVGLVCEGLTNPEIARALYVSPRTVQTHLRHVFRKLGMRSRADLASQATRRRS